MPFPQKKVLRLKTGAVIVAAGMSSRMKKFKPMLNIGGSTIIRRVITTLKQAGCEYIVVVTGNKSNQLDKHISHMGVMCLHNERFSETQMFDSAKIGLEYLQNKCDRILFTPADIPLFSAESVLKLLNTKEELACPEYKGEQGHPLLISSVLITLLLSYNGDGGLSGAIGSTGKKIESIPVDDLGVVLDADTPEDYQKLVSLERKLRKQEDVHFNLQVRLCREKIFFGPGAAEFLILIDEKGSMQTACQYMDMSYSKGWKMINQMEDQLGFQVLYRNAGGMGGGSSQLTPKGKEFTICFIEFQKEIIDHAKKVFPKYFKTDIF